ncbi:MAG: aminopeptidase P family protein [Sphaerochaetaceae bacterium]
MDGIDKRLVSVRAIMAREGIDAWIVNGTDPHLSEYVADRWRTRSWVSAFTGSAGTVVITADRALLWVDSRYFIQAAQQLEGSSFEMQKMDTPQVVDYVTWLSDNLPTGSQVGIDSATLTVSGARLLEKSFSGKRIKLVGTGDWFEELWVDRPVLPSQPVHDFDSQIAGMSRMEKLQQIRMAFSRLGCTHTVVSSLDDIAWTLNLRGEDVEYNPVFLSYLLIGSQQAWLFVDEGRFDPQLLEECRKDLTILPYEAVFDTLSSTLHAGDTVYFSPDKTNLRIAASIPLEVGRLEGRDISTDLKAAKSSIELEGMRRAHLMDGVAMVRLLAKAASPEAHFNELSLAAELHRLRSENKEYLGPSFGPISGYREHGALAHYSATEDSSYELTGDGLLVLDTGGQYRTGMTDITRTLLFGEATVEMRRDYTLVLKGNLALAAQRFPQGTCGYQLDVLARQFMWQYGTNYGHGTGHGIGFRLNVHEGPQSISPRPLGVPLMPGMVISDEPGIYKEGRYGIRIENVIAVKRDGKSEFGEFNSFEVLTLCPFERRLIDLELLDSHEREMIDGYHEWVYGELADHLGESDRDWLRAATLPL